MARTRPSAGLTPNCSPIDEAAASAPKLLVVIDTEEEFDWSKPFARANSTVAAMDDIGKAQDLFDEFGLKPTYVIDYPIASQERGYAALREFAAAGRAQIGAHLHPWVSPPFDEVVNSVNSYPGNLPAELERAKLRELTSTIEANFGARPTIYKAGRYGLGEHTAKALTAEGFEIDLSLCSAFDLSADGGPNYSERDARPYWFGEERSLLGLPTTGAFIGAGGNSSPGLYQFATRPALRPLHLPGILSRLGIVERLLLSPEGHAFEDLKRLTKSLFRRGIRTFSLSFHSPSMQPGHTPYVQNERELHEFLGVLRRYFEFFLEDLHGTLSTPDEVLAQLRPSAPSAPDTSCAS